MLFFLSLIFLVFLALVLIIFLSFLSVSFVLILLFLVCSKFCLVVCFWLFVSNHFCV